MSLLALARKALADVPGLPIEDMVRARTLSENLTILAATMPAIAEPGRWAGLMEAVPTRVRKAMNARARELGLSGLACMTTRPLAFLELIESTVADG